MWSLFRRPKESNASAVLPDESFVAMHGVSEGLPDARVVNQALDGFAHAGAYAWHLSIIIDMVETLENGLPAEAEQGVLTRFADELRSHLQADGNAAILASVTWNGTRQLVLRVRDPERANDYLTSVVDGASPVRQFEYRMEHDPAWALAEQYLAPGRHAA